jgi:hypothetical protein
MLALPNDTAKWQTAQLGLNRRAAEHTKHKRKTSANGCPRMIFTVKACRQYAMNADGVA